MPQVPKKPLSDFLKYSTGTPPRAGVYACRVLEDSRTGFCEDQFFTYQGGSFYYPSSDLEYRGKILGWIGPLERLYIEPDTSYIPDDDIPF